MSKPFTIIRCARSVPVAVVGALLLVLCAACSGSGDAGVSAVPSAATAAAASSTTPTTPATSGALPVSGSPSRKPCDLLTKKMAEEALGTSVGAPVQSSGQGNETCNYRATDPSMTAMVYLTSYAATGTRAVLDQAAAQFKNAYAVDGVGDGARVSIEDHAIGVLKGGFVFGLGLIPPSRGQDIAPVTEKQMVKLANAVVSGM